MGLEGGGEVMGYVEACGITHVIDRTYPKDPNFGGFWTRALAEGSVLARFPVGLAGNDELLVIEMPWVASQEPSSPEELH